MAIKLHVFNVLVAIVASVVVACVATDDLLGQSPCPTCQPGGYPGFDRPGAGYFAPGYNAGNPECFDVPTFQREPGVNLYWHDPCHCWNDPCRNWNCRLADQPLWYAEQSVTFFYRDEDGVFVAASNAAGDVLLTSNDLKPEHEIAGKYLVGMVLDDWCRVEGVYYGQHDWQDEKTVRGVDLVSPFGPRPGVSTRADIALSSRMHNVELNWRRRLHLPAFRWRRVEANFLLGIRYMSIDETFFYSSDNDSALSTVTNDMLGPQIGWQSQFFMVDRAWIDFEMKGALFANDVELTSVYNNALLPGGTFADTDDAMACTFLGDVSLMFNYHCTKHLTFRAGYQAIWVTGMGLATQNLTTDINILALGPAMVDHSRDIVYHGPTLGFVFAY